MLWYKTNADIFYHLLDIIDGDFNSGDVNFSSGCGKYLPAGEVKLKTKTKNPPPADRCPKCLQFKANLTK